MAGSSYSLQSTPRPDSAAISDSDGRAARRLGAVLIVLQAIILFQLSGARLFPGVAAALAIAIGATDRRLSVDRFTFQLMCLTLVIAFLLHYLIAPYPFPEESLFLRTPLAHSVARCLIGIQLLGLATRQSTGLPPIWLAGLGAMALPFAANIQLRESRHGTLLVWIGAFIAASALYSAQARRRIATDVRPSCGFRRVVLASALLASVLLGGGSAIALQRYDRQIETFLRDYLGGGQGMTRSGFAPSGRLNDVLAWKTLDANRVALRVFCEREPGYLRGRAFDTYQRPDWESGWRSWSTDLRMKPLRPVSSVPGLPPVRGGERVYELSPPGGGTFIRMHFWPESPLRGCVLVPLDAHYVALSQHLSRDEHGILHTEDSETSLPYTAFVGAPRGEEPLSEEMRTRLTSLETPIDPSVRELAERLFADCPTPRSRIERVQSWFRTNFTYRLGVRIPRGTDPLVYFLMARPPAHCEFFATGTAVLLKLAGVPCRYVTGYVATEENAVGGYWIARHKDAHAWVEAFDDAAGAWVIVESTPAAGVPTRRSEAVTSQLFDSFRQRWSMFKSMLTTLGTGELLSGAIRSLWSIPGLVATLVVLGATLLWKAPALPEFRLRGTDRRLRKIHRVLAQLDRAARRHGFVRRADETLLEFANRIRRAPVSARWRQEMGRCYELYALQRFRGQLSPEAVDRLRDEALLVLRRSG